MVFQQNEDGPFWMTAEQKILNRYTSLTGKKIDRSKNRDELEEDLVAQNLPITGVKKDLIERAREHGVAVIISEDEAIEGWDRKPKGMLQVLWERGFIDETQVGNYTIGGKKDGFGIIDRSTSLKE